MREQSAREERDRDAPKRVSGVDTWLPPISGNFRRRAESPRATAVDAILGRRHANTKGPSDIPHDRRVVTNQPHAAEVDSSWSCAGVNFASHVRASRVIHTQPVLEQQLYRRDKQKGPD